MKKILLIFFSLFLFNTSIADILEFKKCWPKQKKFLNHSYEEYVFEHKNYEDYFSKDYNHEVFIKFSINTSLQTVVRTIKFDDKAHINPGEIEQISFPIESWDSEFLKATKTEILTDGTKSEWTLIIEMNTGEINIKQDVNSSIGTHFFTDRDKIVCDELFDQSSVEESTSSSGTAFFINSKGNLITNNHVVDGCINLSINYFGKEVETNLIAKDKNLDLALLKADISPKSYINFSNYNPKKLQKIYVAGYPFGKGLSDDLKISSGIISSLKGFEDNSNELQIDAAINSGNSGGPIVGEGGELIAVAVSGLDKEMSEGINFGIKSSAVVNFLGANDLEPSKIKKLKISEDNLLKLLEESTLFIKCEYQ